GLLCRTADQAQQLSNHAQVERCLTAAVTLTDAADAATLIKLHTGRHAALYSLGRLEDGDAVYQKIDRLCTDPLQRTEATLVQMSSLTNRSQPEEAVRLAVDLLQQLGLAVPTRKDVGTEIDRGLDVLDRWVSESTVDDDLRRPEITDTT